MRHKTRQRKFYETTRTAAARMLAAVSLWLGATSAAVAGTPGAPSLDGLQFDCTPRQLARLQPAMNDYLRALQIPLSLVVSTVDAAQGTATFSLRTPESDTDTLHLSTRPEMAIRDEWITLPLTLKKNGKTRVVSTVSKKEIVLALLQHGRHTRFPITGCDIEALIDHVGIRQNTVAWAEVLEWGWPEGGPAKWNGKYWRKGTPASRHPLHEAINDAFIHQSRYVIGCYTATKLVMIQGSLDYYHRVKKDTRSLAMIEKRLMQDGEPLVNIEPGIMWQFEKDFDPAELQRPGKTLDITYGVAANNFVPGDWSYFLNTDTTSSEKTGYEGSNAIYLGRNKFEDYYNENGHSYDYRQKLDEVYQWRHGVFSRTHDVAKIVPLSESDLQQLSEEPNKGGILHTFRVFSYPSGHVFLADIR
jgi:hypothetical protein